MEASARGAAALQQEVQQVAGQLSTQAATMANYGYELAEYDAVFRRLRGGQTNLQRQFDLLRGGAGVVDHRPQPRP